jgi:hypothetical protein
MNEVDRPGYGAPLADGIRSRFVDDVNGLRMHVLSRSSPTAGER